MFLLHKSVCTLLCSWYNYLVTIVLCGFIGWIIIVLPKNQMIIAEMPGKTVSAYLLPFDDIEQRITSKENLEKLKPEIEKHAGPACNNL